MQVLYQIDSPVPTLGELLSLKVQELIGRDLLWQDEAFLGTRVE
jgi:hypothetical protein